MSPWLRNQRVWEYLGLSDLTFLPGDPEGIVCGKAHGHASSWLNLYLVTEVSLDVGLEALGGVG